MGNIMWGIVFLLAGVVLVWLGIRQRKRAQRDYEDDVRRYTASTAMTAMMYRYTPSRPAVSTTRGATL
mgnify:CR=1 FL=1